MKPVSIVMNLRDSIWVMSKRCHHSIIIKKEFILMDDLFRLSCQRGLSASKTELVFLKDIFDLKVREAFNVAKKLTGIRRQFCAKNKVVSEFLRRRNAIEVVERRTCNRRFLLDQDGFLLFGEV